MWISALMSLNLRTNLAFFCWFIRIPDWKQEPAGDKFQFLNDHHCALYMIFYSVGAGGSFIHKHCFLAATST